MFELIRGMMTTAKIVGGINLIGFIITLITESHKFQDPFGTIAFAIASVATLHKAENYQATQLLLTTCVTLWSLRLSSYLFYRMLIMKEDERLYTFFPDRSQGETWFKANKGPPKILRLMGVWFFQALWCCIGLLPICVAQFSKVDQGPPKHWYNFFAQVDSTSWIGFGGFVFFFLMETIADYQKFAFKATQGNNQDDFIDFGLYRYCQHPNYFADIGMWWSLWLAALPVLPKYHLWTVFSPLFMSFMITNVSGVPPLEHQWQKKYGHLPKFQEWKRNTNTLIPWFPRKE